MAYSKLVKTCQDFALGIQSVNEAKTNLEAFRDWWTAEHGRDEFTSSGGSRYTARTMNPYEAFGRHNTPHVPRAVVGVTVATSAPFQVAFSVGAQPTVVRVTKIGTGQWFIEMDGRLEYFWGIAHPSQASSSSTRFCKPVTYRPTGSGTPPGITVTTYEHGGTSFEPADYSFVCVVYGHNHIEPAPTLAVSVPKRPSLAAMPFRRGPFGRRGPGR